MVEVAAAVTDYRKMRSVDFWEEPEVAETVARAELNLEKLSGVPGHTYQLETNCGTGKLRVMMYFLPHPFFDAADEGKNKTKAEIRRTRL
jgi:hypothetical protein